MVDKAVKRLNEEKVEIVLHAGDYVAPFVASHLKQLKADLIGVFGNNDGDREQLRKKFSDLRAEIRGKFAEVMIDGLRIVMVHGEETDLLQSLINVGGYDIIIHGHTHEAKTYHKGRTLVINPGEACGYLTGKPTIATLDTKTLEVKIILL
jgi:putative phosphoesterase